MYEYKSPEELGYKRVYIPKKQFQEITNQKVEDKIEIYISDENILVEFVHSFGFKVLVTLFLPFICLLQLLDCKKTIKDYKDNVFNQKKLGKFSSRTYKVNSRIYEELKQNLKDK